MSYREHALAESLDPYVECAWTLRDPGGSPVRVVPDGCLDAILDLGTIPVRRQEAPRRYAVGAMTRAVVFRPRGPVDLVGVRFRPGAARLFLGIPAAEITDEIAPLAELWGAPAVELAERMSAAPPDARLRLLSDALRARLPDEADGPGALARAACRAFDRARSNRAIGDLADDLGVGRRRLERAFRRDVGLAPAQARGVLRFRRAVRILDSRPDVSLAAVALRAGYHDQPHFTREFHRLAGVPPTAWLRERAGVASVQDAAPPGA